MFGVGTFLDVFLDRFKLIKDAPFNMRYGGSMETFAKTKKVCGVLCVLSIGLVAGIFFIVTMFGIVKQMAESALGRPATFGEMPAIPGGSQTIVLPSMLIRGDLTRVLMHQEVERTMFVYAIADSVLPLMGVDVEFTEDGFILDLSPIFAPTRLQHFRRENVLVFLPGEGVIERCFPKRIDECVKSIVGREYQLKRMYTEKGALARGSPRLLVVIYGRQEYTT